jgi:cellulose synthase (UDP-forming)
MNKYIIKNPWLVRLVYAIGIVTWLFVIYGFIRFIALDPLLYTLLLGPLLAVFTVYHLLSYGINLFYKPLDLEAHGQKAKVYWDKMKGNEPTVDIFLPVCGEPLSIIEATFNGVEKLQYKNKTVYVLDDGANQGVMMLAAARGFNYTVRPNKGHMKKAGNLKHGYENSTGEFIIVFDADFVPNPKFIHELLPYMDDKRTAIVQSPQHFQTDDKVHGRSPLEFGAGHVQEDFYRVIQTSRNVFGGAICVGSNAIYRRSALDEIGGTVQIEHSEDVHTGFQLVNKGYRIQYIPLILATGLCPADMHSYFHQQHRWCSGSMSLLFSKEFWTSKLTIAQKLCYSSGFLYYLTHGLSLILSFQIFLLLFRHYQWISLWYAIPFIPYILYSFVLLPLFRVTEGKPGTILARQSHSFFYGQAIIRKLLNLPIGWRSSGAKMAVSSEYTSIFRAQVIYLAIYLLLVLVLIAYGKFPIFNYQYYTVLFWVFYTVAVNLYLLIYSHKDKKDLSR